MARSKIVQAASPRTSPINARHQQEVPLSLNALRIASALLLASALASIRDQARTGFLAVLIESRGRDYEIDRANLEQALKAKGIPYLSLDSVRADWPRLRYPRDQHWNVAGHREVGKILAPLVRARLSR